MKNLKHAQPSPGPHAHVKNWLQRYRTAILSVTLIVMTFAVFGQTLTHDFVSYDDDEYVYENPMVVKGLTCNGFVWAFTHFYSFNWHPITWLSHMLDCQLYGLHPGGHHLTSVILHSATAVLLFLLLQSMTNAIWRSWLVAAIFAIHPLRAESVAWVAERKDVLSGLFFILIIASYLFYTRKPSGSRYVLCLFLFLFGLMCKPMLVSVPLVLLLLDYWPLDRSKPIKQLLLEKLPFAALSFAACIVTFFAQKGAIHSGGLFSLNKRLGNALISYVVYLRQMVYPTGLVVFYPPRETLVGWQVVFSGALVFAVSAFALAQWRKRPWIVVGWTWYLLMLLPVLGIVQVGGQANADRYTYLPQIGVYISLSWWAQTWRLSRSAASALTIGVLGTLMVCAWKQTTYWKNDETLWVRATAKTSGNATANYNLGNIFLNRGDLDTAIFRFEEALKFAPNYSEAHVNLGNAFGKKGNVDAEIAQFQIALRIKPDDEDTQFNLGNALLQKGDADGAIAHFEEALKLKPNDADVYINLANVWIKKGDMPQAIAHLKKAVDLNPDNPDADNNLALLLSTVQPVTLTNATRAVELAQRASHLAAELNPVFLRTLAIAFSKANRIQDALQTIKRAIFLAQSNSNVTLVEALQRDMKVYQSELRD